MPLINLAAVWLTAKSDKYLLILCEQHRDTEVQYDLLLQCRGSRLAGWLAAPRRQAKPRQLSPSMAVWVWMSLGLLGGKFKGEKLVWVWKKEDGGCVAKGTEGGQSWLCDHSLVTYRFGRIRVIEIQCPVGLIEAICCVIPRTLMYGGGILQVDRGPDSMDEVAVGLNL